MITEITHKIKISETEAKKKAAYFSESAIYDKVREELTFKVKNAKNKKNRLIYIDGKVVIHVDGTDITITSTLHTVEEFNTTEQVLDRIKELGLEYIPPEDPSPEDLPPKNPMGKKGK